MAIGVTYISIKNGITVGTTMGFPGGSVVKNLSASTGDAGSIPGLGRFPGEGNDSPVQYACLENPMDRGARWATVHGVMKESDTIYRLNNNSQQHVS